jgi:ribosomal-protein-alanine N-acetyltransferase
VEITVRTAKPTDLAVLLEIETACFADPWNKKDLEQYDCFVATVGTDIAGFLIWRQIFPGEGAAPPEQEILNVAVRPDYRRRGIARTLLNHLLKRPAIYFLEVRKSNTAARQLYEHLGFVEAGRRSGYYSHPTETAIVMKMKRC